MKTKNINRVEAKNNTESFQSPMKRRKGLVHYVINSFINLSRGVAMGDSSSVAFL